MRAEGNYTLLIVKVQWAVKTSVQNFSSIPICKQRAGFAESLFIYFPENSRLSFRLHLFPGINIYFSTECS